MEKTELIALLMRVMDQNSDEVDGSFLLPSLYEDIHYALKTEGFWL